MSALAVYANIIIADATGMEPGHVILRPERAFSNAVARQSKNFGAKVFNNRARFIHLVQAV